MNMKTVAMVTGTHFSYPTLVKRSIFLSLILYIWLSTPIRSENASDRGKVGLKVSFTYARNVVVKK